MKMIVAGLDGALRNFGIAMMEFDLETEKLSVANLNLITTEKSKLKSVRAASEDLKSVRTITTGVEGEFLLRKPAFVFAEVPSGGQSHSACRAFGIVTGIYGTLSSRYSMVEVLPRETKEETVGTRTASKQEMIEWATETYPDAPWLRARGKADGKITNANEHLADACAVVHAGIRTEQFRSVVQMAAQARAIS